MRQRPPAGASARSSAFPPKLADDPCCRLIVVGVVGVGVGVGVVVVVVVVVKVVVDFFAATL